MSSNQNERFLEQEYQSEEEAKNEESKENKENDSNLPERAKKFLSFFRKEGGYEEASRKIDSYLQGKKTKPWHRKKEPVGINVQDNNGMAAIHYAAELGCFKSIKLLLKHKANPTIANINSCTPLMLAANVGNQDVLNCLLEQKKVKDSINAKDKDGKTALYYAAIEGNLEAVDLLLKNGAKPDLIKDLINQKDESGFTELHDAILNEDLNEVKALLKIGADLTILTEMKKTPLILAAGQECTPIMIELLKYEEVRKTINQQDDRGGNAFNYSAALGHFEGAKLLSDNGSNLGNIEKERGFTPLMSASILGNTDIMNLILGPKGEKEIKREEGEEDKINYKNKEGMTALYLAAIGGNIEAVNLLLENGAKPSLVKDLINKREEVTRYTLLHKAVMSFNLEDYDSDNDLDFNPDLSSIQPLLMIGAKLDAKDKEGNTPLMLAALSLNKKAVDILLKHKADPELINEGGKSALMLAKEALEAKYKKECEEKYQKDKDEWCYKSAIGGYYDKKSVFAAFREKFLDGNYKFDPPPDYDQDPIVESIRAAINKKRELEDNKVDEVENVEKSVLRRMYERVKKNNSDINVVNALELLLNKQETSQQKEASALPLEGESDRNKEEIKITGEVSAPPQEVEDQPGLEVQLVKVNDNLQEQKDEHIKKEDKKEEGSDIEAPNGKLDNSEGEKVKKPKKAKKAEIGEELEIVCI